MTLTSMTGFGLAEKSTPSGTFRIELRSVNNRYLEFMFRIPRVLSSLETNIKSLINEYITRGSVTVFIWWSNEDSQEKLVLNPVSVAQVIEISNTLNKKYGIKGEITIPTIFSIGSCLKKESINYSDQELWKHLKPVLVSACIAFSKSREVEGGRILSDVQKNLAHIIKTTLQIQKRAPTRLKNYTATMRNRIANLTGNQVDETRLSMEIAVMADKLDITEECTRLSAHSAQVKDDLESKDPVGKRINFILQEMNREANTICSKANDVQITTWAVSLKESIEKIREQIQNIE